MLLAFCERTIEYSAKNKAKVMTDLPFPLHAYSRYLDNFLNGEEKDMV